MRRMRSAYCASYTDNPAAITTEIIVCTLDTLETAKSRDVLSGNWWQFCSQLHKYKYLGGWYNLKIITSVVPSTNPEPKVLGFGDTMPHIFIVGTNNNKRSTCNDAATPFLCITLQHEFIQLRAGQTVILRLLLFAGCSRYFGTFFTTEFFSIHFVAHIRRFSVHGCDDAYRVQRKKGC